MYVNTTVGSIAKCVPSIVEATVNDNYYIFFYIHVGLWDPIHRGFVYWKNDNMKKGGKNVQDLVKLNHVLLLFV